MNICIDYDDFLHGFIVGWSGTGCHASGKNPEEPED